MTDQTENNLYSRRKALRVLGAGVAASGALLVTACKSESKPDTSKKAEPAKKAEPKKEMAKKEEPAAGGDSCADPAKLDAQSKNMRKTLQYVEKSPHADKQCSGCLQWLPGDKPEACGGCKLFTGGVSPNGYCLSYAPAKQG